MAKNDRRGIDTRTGGFEYVKMKLDMTKLNYDEATGRYVVDASTIGLKLGGLIPNQFITDQKRFLFERTQVDGCDNLFAWVYYLWQNCSIKLIVHNR